MTGLRVIIADDHPLMLDGIASLLDGSEFEVIERCSNGADARAKIAAHAPDIALVDIHMPHATGLDLLREARSTGSSTKFVLLTASLDSEPLVEAVDLKVDGLVLKHAASEVLLMCLRSVMCGQSWIDREAMEVVLRAMSRARAIQPESALTKRELEVAKLVVVGLRNKEIAAEMGITEGTVKMYLHTLFDKLGVGTRTELAMLVRDQGL